MTSTVDKIKNKEIILFDVPVSMRTERLCQIALETPGGILNLPSVPREHRFLIEETIKQNPYGITLLSNADLELCKLAVESGLNLKNISYFSENLAIAAIDMNKYDIIRNFIKITDYTPNIAKRLFITTHELKDIPYKFRTAEMCEDALDRSLENIVYLTEGFVIQNYAELVFRITNSDEKDLINNKNSYLIALKAMNELNDRGSIQIDRVMLNSQREYLLNEYAEAKELRKEGWRLVNEV